MNENYQAAFESMQPIATVLFALAIAHTFLVKKIVECASKFRKDSVAENLFHFLGEIEVVFGLWAALLIAVWAFRFGSDSAVAYLDRVKFTEPAFVFVIMCIAATRPILFFVHVAIEWITRLVPGPVFVKRYFIIMSLGSLLGSLITEPAAMTVSALLLKRNFFDKSVSEKFKYVSLGLLFVNISLGGTLTHFAAPPVLMVARPWGWDTAYMFTHFGIKAIVIIFLSTLAATSCFFSELKKLRKSHESDHPSHSRKTPLWLVVSHFSFLILAILNSHHMSFFVPLFLLFLGWCAVTTKYQDEIRLKESLLVAFFLGGLITLGKLQEWWLQPLLAHLSSTQLFFGTIGLTAFTDNAALTYLGTLVPDLPEITKHLLVAGAVTGGGLTVIANAPNPAGYGILRDSFGDEGINPIYLMAGAVPFTAIAAIVFFLF